MSYLVECSKCFKKIYVYPQRYFNRKNFFCSKKCEGEYRRDICTTKIIAKCVVCKKELKLKKYGFDRRNKNNEITCSRKCMGALREKKYLGRSNPNTKYNLDDNFLREVDTKEKAYVLGWIASDGHVGKNGSISIQIKNIDREILEKIKKIVCDEVLIFNAKQREMSSIRFCSTIMSKHICKWLEIIPGKKDRTVKMPHIKFDLKWHFIRGFFDGDGSVRKRIKNKYIDCNISTYSDSMRKSIKKLCDICGICCINDYKWKQIRWSGKNAMLFLDRLYYSSSDLFLKRKHDIYLDWKMGTEEK